MTQQQPPPPQMSQQQRQCPPGFPQHQMPGQQQFPSYIQGTQQDPNKRTMQERIQSILPPPISQEQLYRTETMTVPQLCQFGREIVQEISIRAMNVLSFFKLEPSRRSNPAIDLKAILAYSKQLFIKLQEIRVRVDRARANRQIAAMTEDIFFNEVTNPEPIDQSGESSTKKALVEQFETNRARIVDMNSRIKKLEWYAASIDPRS